MPPRPSEAAPPSHRRGGRIAVAAVVAAAAIGLVGVAVIDADRAGSGAAAPPASATAPMVEPTRPAPATSTTVVVEIAAGVQVERRSPSDLDAAYRAIAPDDGVAAIGPARCAQGAPEERSWSRPEQPRVSAGRYRCLVNDGRAHLWWTDNAEGVLAHATAPDDDLAALFAWWLADADT